MITFFFYQISHIDILAIRYCDDDINCRFKVFQQLQAHNAESAVMHCQLVDRLFVDQLPTVSVKCSN